MQSYKMQNETDETPTHSRPCKTINMPTNVHHGNDMSNGGHGARNLGLMGT